MDFLKVAIKKHLSNIFPRLLCNDQPEERVLCRIDDITDGGCKEIDLQSGADFTICLVRQNAAVFAYRNSCPHTGAPLNWIKDKFLSLDGAMIQCALHGALFRIEDGLCIWGPCLNKNLEPAPIVVRNGDIMLMGEKKTASPH